MVNVTLKFRLEYYLVLSLAAVLRRLSRPQALTVGGRIGLLACWLLPKRRKLAEENLRRAYPELPATKIRRLAETNFWHIGRSSVEMLRLDLFDTDDLERCFVLENMQHMHAALALGKGAILLTGHLGFWEAGHYVFPALGQASAAVAKPMKNPLTDQYFSKIRTSFGGEMIDSRKGARKILKALQQGKAVGILLDQHISPPGSVPTDFFGRKAYTTTAISNLAMKYQVPVVPIFCQRLPDDRYRIWAEPMLLLEGEGEQAIQKNTQQLTTLIEQAVRLDPSQWFWMHKRWRVPETADMSANSK